jgi:hypothetical protein
MAADDQWPPEPEDQWPEPVEPQVAEAAAAAPHVEAETAPSDPWIERDVEPERQIDLEPAEGLPPEDSVPGLDSGSRDVGIDDKAEIPPEPEPSVVEAEEAAATIAPEAAEAEPDMPVAPELAEAEPDMPVAPEPAEAEPAEAEPDVPVPPEPAEAEPAEAEPAEAEPDFAIAAQPVEDSPDRHARFTSKLKPSEDRARGREDVASEPEMPPPSPEETAEEHPALYVVEQRMFRGKQARVLSDGTIEAETAEGWMRFEDFDHLEEYLDAMADLGR